MKAVSFCEIQNQNTVSNSSFAQEENKINEKYFSFTDSSNLEIFLEVLNDGDIVLVVAFDEASAM